MPGARFQRVARDHFATLTRLVENPVMFTKFQMNRDEDRQSFVSTLLKQGEEEEIVKWAAVAMYGGGSDTVCSNWCATLVVGKCLFTILRSNYRSLQF